MLKEVWEQYLNGTLPHLCTYCDNRHFGCEHDLPLFDWDKIRKGEIEGCEYFKLGKCFHCAIRVAHNGKWVDGVCNDVNDFGGCENYKEV